MRRGLGLSREPPRLQSAPRPKKSPARRKRPKIRPSQQLLNLIDTTVCVSKPSDTCNHRGSTGPITPDVLKTIARGSPTPAVKPCDTTRLDLDVLVTGMRKTLRSRRRDDPMSLTSRGLRTSILDKHDNDFNGEDALACAGHRC
jgi:hypothetical protein